MKFKISRDLIKKQLLNISKIISFNYNSINNNGVHFVVKNDKIIISATNGFISYQTEIFSSPNLIIESIGNFLIQNKYILEIIKKIEDEFINFNLIENKILTIKANNIKVNLNIKEDINYPQIDFNTSEGVKIFLEKNEFKKYLHKVNFIVNDQEKRIVLTGVKFKITEEVLELTSTDSYRLARAEIKGKYNIDQNEKVFIIPSTFLNEILKLINDDIKELVLIVKDNEVYVTFDKTIIKSKVIEGQYPEVDNIIPTEFLTKIKINRKNLINSIDRASVLSNDFKSTIVNLEIKNQEFTIRSRSSEIGDLEELITDFEITGSPQKASFNSHYLLDAITSFDSENIFINMNDPLKAIIINSDQETSLIQLILPVRFGNS